MLPLSQIVNVQLNNTPNAPSRASLDKLALFTYEAGNVFNDATQYIECAVQADVDAAFGTNSETARATRPFFAQSPKPKSLFIARWEKKDRTVEASTAKVLGAPITETMANFKAITLGYLSFVVNGSNVDISEVDLSEALTLADVVTKVNAKLPSNAQFKIEYDETGKRAIVSSKTAGADKSVSYTLDKTLTGSYLGNMLKLEDGQADQVKGTDAVTLKAQSTEATLANFLEYKRDWYNAAFVGALTDDEIRLASDWIQSAELKTFSYTTLRASHIENKPENIFKQLKDKKNDRTFIVYDKNDQYANMSAMARGLAVNFNANNTTITLKFKTLPTISAEDLTLTEANKCKALGINYYAYYDTAAMLAEGMMIGGRFWDEVHGLDWFVDGVQKEVFATLYQSQSKVPHTDKGVARLLAAVNRVGLEGVKNGLFALGIWHGDPFGELENGGYLDQGFYSWADTVDNQSTSDKDNRIAPPIQVALKLAGAIHSVDILVNFNR